MERKRDYFLLLLILFFIVAPFIRILLNAGIFPDTKDNSKHCYRNVGVDLKLSNKAKPDYLVILTPNSGYEWDPGTGESEEEDTIDFPVEPEKAEKEDGLLLEEYEPIHDTLWTRQRWLEECSYDNGMTYRTVGLFTGFCIGATVGMVVGKGFQGKSVDRVEEHPENAWGDPAWTEEYYSYDNKYAPYQGAFMGGFVGSCLGYMIGVKEDKEYYSTVPREVRITRVHNRSKQNSAACAGSCVWGTVMGFVSGCALYAPSSAESGQFSFGFAEGLLGLSVGGILGAVCHSGIEDRALKKSYAITDENENKRFNVNIVPLDQLPYCIRLSESPDGKTRYDYKVELIRVDF